ncbi:MAG: hypothetical protein QNJ73_10370 [Gammaproteobacteria bacterium]|nr:hypothetical protein [Gammaproteobacteria bacterium]
MDETLGKDAAFSPDRALEDIRALIADVEACLPAAGDDREASLQRQVFRERREQARALVGRLDGSCGVERMLLDGDLHRAWQALAMSRAFFRKRARKTAGNGTVPNAKT